MKKILFVVLAGITGFSFADGVRPYVRVSAGVALLQDADLGGDTAIQPGVQMKEMEFDTGYSVGFAGGVKFANLPIRAELEFLYQRNDLDNINLTPGWVYTGDGKLTVMALMLNGFYDFENKTIVTPYLMGGVGVVRAKMKLNDVGSETDTVAAFQLGAGLDFKVTDHVSLDAGYRFMMTSDPDFGGVDAEITGHRIELGIRYTF
ncbi:MAG: outer membrane beta-barrel protein [Kiritimatiellales bacterium]